VRVLCVSLDLECRQLRHQKHTAGLEDPQNFVAGHESHLGDAMRVTEEDTDLRGCQSLASKLANVLDNIFWRGLEP
jgi:hypothetical protein